jgi:hypothetical protein
METFEMTHEETVDILDILYIKLMRLKTAHRTCLSFMLSPDIESRYPDIVYSIKYSFSVDAYTTLNAMLTSGTYSFQTLQKYDDAFAESFRKARAELKKLCPKLQDRRNKMFCHCNEKQSEDHINEILRDFSSLLQVLTRLHRDAMRIFDVSESEIRIMSGEKFSKLNAEFEEFMQGLREISMNRFYDDLDEITGGTKK